MSMQFRRTESGQRYLAAFHGTVSSGGQWVRRTLRGRLMVTILHFLTKRRQYELHEISGNSSDSGKNRPFFRGARWIFRKSSKKWALWSKRSTKYESIEKTAQFMTSMACDFAKKFTNQVDVARAVFKIAVLRSTKKRARQGGRH